MSEIEQSIEITGLSHEGRGISHIDGKTTFISLGLAGETVNYKLDKKRKTYNEATATNVLKPATTRIEPVCPHFGQCGGCRMQHMSPEGQLAHKQTVLVEQLKHFGDCQATEILPPLTGPTTGYRHKARLGVRYVHKKQSVLVGFREVAGRFLTDMNICPVLVQPADQLIKPLRELIASLTNYDVIPQIELAAGDDQLALIFRHLKPLPQPDLNQLIKFGQEHNLHIYLQPKGPDSVQPLWPEHVEPRLYYQLPAFDLSLGFHPTDFTQVNLPLNRKMVGLALKLLDPSADEHILDLFCGLGNFTLPIATQAAHVTGVEGNQAMVERGYENAKRNKITNVDFYAADLTDEELNKFAWANRQYDKILLDPPRTGADKLIPYLAEFKPKRIVYVSCNPATLARDAGLICAQGYQLSKAGIMDMFPHTAHVESIAVFDK